MFVVSPKIEMFCWYFRLGSETAQKVSFVHITKFPFNVPLEDNGFEQWTEENHKWSTFNTQMAEMQVYRNLTWKEKILN